MLRAFSSDEFANYGANLHGCLVSFRGMYILKASGRRPPRLLGCASNNIRCLDICLFLRAKESAGLYVTDAFVKKIADVLVIQRVVGDLAFLSILDQPLASEQP